MKSSGPSFHADAARRRLSAPGWRVAGFVTVFVLFQLSWEAARGGAVERFVIHDLTVRPAVLVINLITPAVRAQAAGPTLQAAGGGLNVRNGCEGLEALFLLAAAFAIAPLAWRDRLPGLLVGAGLTYAANQLRLVGLFYAYRSDPGLFDLLHSTVTPIAMVLVVAAYFYVCLSRARASVAAA